MRMDSVWKRTWYGLAIWLVAGNLPGAFAQSDPAGFGAVINVPPKVVGNSGSIGSNTQLNLSDGGTIGTRFDGPRAAVAATSRLTFPAARLATYSMRTMAAPLIFRVG